MKTILGFLFIAATAFAASPNPDAIVSAYKHAHQQKDLERLMALVEFSPKTPSAIRDLKKASFRTQLSLAVPEVEVLPLDAEDQNTFAAMRQNFDFTLEPVAKLVVLFDEAQQTGPTKNGKDVSYLGIKEGAYRIVTTQKRDTN